MALPLEGLRLSVTRELQGVLEEAADLIFDKLKEKAGLVDHTLDDLEKMGHPYAVRDPRPPHDADEVHRQSSTLFDNIKKRKVNQYAIDVGISEQDVPYLRAVLYGTRFMVPRPFIATVFNENHERLNRLFQDGLAEGVAKARLISG